MFFFSSRRRHTRCLSDWSSDVCSSDLIAWLHFGGGTEMLNDLLKGYNAVAIPTGSTGAQMGGWFRKEIKNIDDFKGLKFRSEERRVGKEDRTRRRPEQ